MSRGRFYEEDHNRAHVLLNENRHKSECSQLSLISISNMITVIRLLWSIRHMLNSDWMLPLQGCIFLAYLLQSFTLPCGLAPITLLQVFGIFSQVRTVHFQKKCIFHVVLLTYKASTFCISTFTYATMICIQKKH